MQNEPDGWSGDVKYHAGARRELDDDNDPNTIDLTIQMPPNPSHLEAVNPVVEGMARAAGTRADQPGPAVFDPSVTLPMLIHGDALFLGQGVVAETLNMYRLPGYTTGGTIHIIANNQIGFTTDPGRVALDPVCLRPGQGLPHPHHPRQRRRPRGRDHGGAHGLCLPRALPPRFPDRPDRLPPPGPQRGRRTGLHPARHVPHHQPASHRAPDLGRGAWSSAARSRPSCPTSFIRKRSKTLQSSLDKLDPEALREPIPPPPPPGAARRVRTTVQSNDLRRLNRELLTMPEGFHLHPRLARIRQRREKMLEEDGANPDGQEAPAQSPRAAGRLGEQAASIDWSAAEELALATILEDGTPIRLTGQDVRARHFQPPPRRAA